MDARLLKLLKEQIEKIEQLKNSKNWGPEYQVWKDITAEIVKSLFGDDYLELFEHLDTPELLRTNYNYKWYYEELNKKKKLLEEFIREKTRLEAESYLSIGKMLGLTDYDLHHSIKEVSQQRFEVGHYADAVEAAFKEVIERVREFIKDKTGENLDGDRAMNRAFGCENQVPLVKFNDLKDVGEMDEQKGIMYLFKGIVGIRNRKAHENVILDDPYRAIEYLALASLLMRLLDEYAK